MRLIIYFFPSWTSTLGSQKQKVLIFFAACHPPTLRGECRKATSFGLGRFFPARISMVDF